MSPVKMLLAGEHVHGATLPAGIAILPSVSSAMTPPRRHPDGKHMRVITIGCDNLIALFHVKADSCHDCFLPDIKVQKPPIRPIRKAARLFPQIVAGAPCDGRL